MANKKRKDEVKMKLNEKKREHIFSLSRNNCTIHEKIYSILNEAILK